MREVTRFTVFPRSQVIVRGLLELKCRYFGFFEILNLGEEKLKPVALTTMLPPFTETELSATCDDAPPEDVSDTTSALAA